MVRITTPVRGALADDRGRCVDAVEARHPHVHQHDVGLRAPSEIDGLLPVAGDADELCCRRVPDEGSEAVPEDRMVVGDEHSDR
jgi:hypothetical protein